jgi:hypothetical protein
MLLSRKRYRGSVWTGLDGGVTYTNKGMARRGIREGVHRIIHVFSCSLLMRLIREIQRLGFTAHMTVKYSKLHTYVCKHCIGR